MALNHIRSCQTTTVGEIVVLSGVDKNTGNRITLRLDRKEFNEWISGMPVKYAFSNLDLTERRFLTHGTKIDT